jgi:hypothetical protein
LLESYFRFGSLRARLRTDHVGFSGHFLRIFHDCLDPEELPTEPPLVNLKVTDAADSDFVVAEIFPYDANSAAAALEVLFPELQLAFAGCDAADGSQFFVRGTDPQKPVIVLRANQILIDRGLPWQTIVGHYFVHHALSLQPDYVFFHGATLAVGNNGVLLSGSKGAGKSTLSLALAARGHGFLGDEYAGIERATRVVVPFRRSVSIRRGPQAQAVQRFLVKNIVDRDTLPDGTERWRVPVSRMFPAATSRPVRLTHALFLTGISNSPGATAFEFSAKDLPLLGPLHATLMGKSAGERTVTFLKLFGGIWCYLLTPGGTPDETAELIENIVEGKWDTASKKKPSMSVPFAG